MLFLLLSVSLFLHDFSKYSKLSQAIANEKLESEIKRYHQAGYTNLGNIKSIEFPQSLKKYACVCFSRDQRQKCLAGDTDMLWTALSRRDMTRISRSDIGEVGELYKGLVYRVDSRDPVEALELQYQGQSILGKNLSLSARNVAIRHHLRYGSDLYTSTSIDRDGIEEVFLQRMIEALAQEDGTLWLKKKSATIVDYPLHGGGEPDEKLHPKHWRLKLLPVYAGFATGIKNIGRINKEQKDVTTLGFQATYVQYIGAWIPPLKKKSIWDIFTSLEENELEENTSPRALLPTIFATPWRSLITGE